MNIRLEMTDIRKNSRKAIEKREPVIITGLSYEKDFYGKVLKHYFLGGTLHQMQGL